HRKMKELPVYTLSVSKTGPKLTKGDPNGVPILHFGVLGTLHATNATMADFTQAMQAVALDRPVIDQTGLEGRFDFDLNWKRDDSQFSGIEATIPPLADAPPLYTAIQEQLGLKLDATNARVEVLVIDHVEKPSEK
ncbi:MAG TPA: TIGR03435 family protein, partial [Syntrophobacteraceae bacterium]|nr:TIGR03435 family protein [Syntrophobacteraceae bacterium]